MQTERPSINKESLEKWKARMEAIMLKAQGALELIQAQMEELEGEVKETNGKEQTAETGSRPQPGRTEEEYANGNNCRAGSCD